MIVLEEEGKYPGSRLYDSHVSDVIADGEAQDRLSDMSCGSLAIR
jgi:hypothetical protein